MGTSVKAVPKRSVRIGAGSRLWVMVGGLAMACTGCYIALVPPSTPDYYRRPVSAYTPVAAPAATGSEGTVADGRHDVRLPAPPADWRRPLLAVWALSMGEGLSPSLAEPLTASVRADLEQSGWFRVVIREEMSKVLKEHQIQMANACDTLQCAVEYGRLLAAQAFLVGTVSRVENTYLTVLTLVNVESGEIWAVGKASSPGTNVVYELTLSATEDLVQNMVRKGAH